MTRLIAVVLLTVVGVSAPADPTPSLAVDRKDVRLSESVWVTIAVEGAAPLRVELPADLLDDSAAANWRVRSASPAIVTDLPGGRQKWEQRYRADPYVPGDAVRLAFAPVKVSAGADPQPKPVAWPAVDVKVTTEVAGDPSETRPPTGIEELTPPPVESFTGRTGAIAAGAVAGIVALVLVAVWLRRRGRRPRVPTPVVAVLGALAAVERDRQAGTLTAAAFADRVADAVRGFVQRRTGLPASRLTTAELLAAGDAVAAWDAVAANDLRAVLTACDRMRFASAESLGTECDEVLAATRRFVGPMGVN